MLSFAKLSETYKAGDVPQPAYHTSLAEEPFPGADVSSIPSSDAKLVRVELPRNLEFKYKDDSYYTYLYRLASFYFYHCSTIATIAKRMSEEAMRRGVEWVPRFQSKCPNCGQEYLRNVTKCAVCGFTGKFLKPDVAQQKMLVNYEGTPLLTHVNRYGWSIYDLCSCFLVLTIVYNQPVILARSLYVSDTQGVISAEIPQEFIAIPPSSARMLFDERGDPGDGTGFTIFNRSRAIPMQNYHGRDEEGHRLYPARWCICDEFTGSGPGTYYSDKEIYHKTYGITSINYGLPVVMLVATEVRALIALTARTEKYYSTGHPLGILTITNMDPISMSTIKRSLQNLMEEDPYSTPLIGIPPAASDSGTAKWIPLADNPTNQLVAVKRELLERVCALYGVPSFIMGDLSAHKGVSNEAYQITLLDRELFSLRRHANGLLDWIIAKYPTITDWVLRIVEPPDKQSTDDADAFAQRIENAKGLQELGFRIISQNNGEIEVSATPMSYDPIEALTAKMLNPNDPDGNNGDEQQARAAKTAAAENEVEELTKSAHRTYSEEQVREMLKAAYKLGVEQ